MAAPDGIGWVPLVDIIITPPSLDIANLQTLDTLSYWQGDSGYIKGAGFYSDRRVSLVVSRPLWLRPDVWDRPWQVDSPCSYR